MDIINSINAIKYDCIGKYVIYDNVVSKIQRLDIIIHTSVNYIYCDLYIIDNDDSIINAYYGVDMNKLEFIEDQQSARILYDSSVND